MGSKDSKPIQQMVVQNELNLSTHELMKEACIVTTIIVAVELIKYWLNQQKKKYAKKVIAGMTMPSNI
jgi:hypothetical protein